MKKIDMAKEIVKYLSDACSLPADDHPEVKRTMKYSKANLEESYSIVIDAKND